MARSLLLFLICLALPAYSQVVINEIQSSNGITVDDEDGDSEDWIELYNGGTEAVSLDGYWLSDDYGNPSRWTFPDVTLQAGDTLLVWASGKNRRTPGEPLHTNFSISASGEEILLHNAEGDLLDEVEPRPIPTDVSWGRSPSGADNWVYFSEPTPGAANDTDGYQEILEPPSFSATGGFYDNAFDLEITHPDPDVTIVYTLDGSVPNANNLDGTSYQYKMSYPQTQNSEPTDELFEREFRSHTYAQAVEIQDRSDEDNTISAIATSYHNPPYYLPSQPVPKGTMVRARAIKDGAIPSPITTHTYFITEDGQRPSELTIISLGVQEDGLFSYDDGIYVPGARFDEWRINNPSLNADGASAANYQMRGREWERLAHLELFEPEGSEAALKQDIGVRVHGGWSRSGKLKSFRLYARNAYGDSRFNYPMFPGRDDTGFNRLLLRNSGNDRTYTMFRDAMIQALGEGMRMDTQAYRPTALYLNGEYWGILNLRERYDRHYLGRTYGVDPDNVDFITNYNDIGEGDDTHYRETIDYIENNSLTVNSNFAYVQTRVDTDNYMDYTIANIFADNRDWPGNNIDYWRLRTDEYRLGSPEGHDGRWRWLWFDADFGFGLYDGASNATRDTLTFATEAGNTDWPNPDWSTLLLRSLLENANFRNDFINRFADLLNTNFSSQYVTGVIDSMKATLEPEIPNHIDRWSHPSNLDNWHYQVQIMTDFANARPNHQRQHIRDYFGLSGDYQLTIDRGQNGGHVRVNTIEINDSTPGVGDAVYPWTGQYFSNVPIELEAMPAPGYRFSHWEGLPDGTPAKTTVNRSSNLEVTAHFVEAPSFLHAWLFDGDMANNTPFESINAHFSHTEHSARLVFHSALQGYPFDEEHEDWRRASMERRGGATPINYKLETPYADANLRALQIKQPFRGDAGENTLILELPTTGHSDVVLRFAAVDEGAAEQLLVDYSVSENPVWTTAGLAQTILPLGDEFQLYSINFAGLDAVNDNPHFRVRIRFAGEDMHADDGNRVTFNNITLDLQQDSQLGYFWFFDNNLANNTELETIAPHFAIAPGAHIEFQSALEAYPDTDRTASMERRNRPVELNYQTEGNYGLDFSEAEGSMRGMQVTQPFQGAAGENTLIFHMPTAGMANPVFRFAAMDEGAAQYVRIDYAINAGQPVWRTLGLEGHTFALLEDSYQLYEADFSNINSVNDNPHFRVRMRFVGDDMTTDNGDRVTFNNISLHLKPLPNQTPVTPNEPDPDHPNAPANHRFAQAQPISGASGSRLGTTLDASTESGEPDHAAELETVTSGNSVWWVWQAPETERMRFSTHQSYIDTVLAVYVGDDLENLTRVPAQYLAADQLWFLAEAGETYRIAVAGAEEAEGDVALTWQAAASEAMPIVIDFQPGEPGIICEIDDCSMDESGNLQVSADSWTLNVTLPDDGVHRHQLQGLDGEGAAQWSSEFAGERSGTWTRVIADVQGQPVLITRFYGTLNSEHLVEAYSDGRSRHRIVATNGDELLHLLSRIPGLSVSADAQAHIRTELLIPESADPALRALLEVDDEVELRVRYQRFNSVSDQWEDTSDLLKESRFPAGSRVVLEREDGAVEVIIETDILNDLYF
ncbi:CotH kinase family protein [Marinimicrobium sp. ABcell2]|uniref:CotH kinase family protein n=1 Tax=Marinimicrobium sp. ABcell2 TaxID=3069751 RepID=UPI0027B291E4|nr:CotH kinase family protein [Marinimicrobium sp. ABcell2]MDQ2077993.1 CotH kinase family protein [Marinimicrobium sp. ABcell2]